MMTTVIAAIIAGLFYAMLERGSRGHMHPSDRTYFRCVCLVLFAGICTGSFLATLVWYYLIV